MLLTILSKLAEYLCIKTITSYQYTYDQFSNVLTETRFEDNKTTTITNTYNERNELIESVQDTEGVITTYSYQYDLFGNKSEKVITDTGTDSRYYTYNHLNRLTNISGDRSASIIYDNNGNIREEDYGSTSVLYTYDELNRLISYTDEAGVVITYTYDGDGNRLTKTINDGVTTNTVTYVNDVNREHTEVLELTANQGLETYVYGNKRINSSNEIYLHDKFGSVVAHTDTNALVTNTFSYSPFGEMSAIIGVDDVNHYGYKGEVHDSNTLQFLRARYLNVDNAMFITEDTYLGDNKDPLSQNRYAFVLNNPFKYSDPSGHWAVGFDEEPTQSSSQETIVIKTKSSSQSSTKKSKHTTQKKKLEKIYDTLEEDVEKDNLGKSKYNDEKVKNIIHFSEELIESNHEKDNYKGLVDFLDEDIVQNNENSNDVFLSDDYFIEIENLYDEIKKENDKWYIFDGSKQIAARIVLNKLMDDLENNPNLLTREHDNYTRFFDSFDNNVRKLDGLDDGEVTDFSITEEIHYFRNRLNTYSGAPILLDEMIDLAARGEWNLFYDIGTAYHRYNYGELEGALNVKFLSSDGRFEAVYNTGTGKIVLDSANMGTYNYAPVPPHFLGHDKYDVVPFEIWGNDESLSFQQIEELESGHGTELSNNNFKMVKRLINQRIDELNQN